MYNRKLLVSLILSGLGSLGGYSEATEIGPQKGGSITIQNGDTVTVTTGGTGVDSTVDTGDGLKINGEAIIDVSGDSGSIGVALDNGKDNDLGNASQIKVTDSGTSSNSATRGIYISGTNSNTSVTATQLQIQVESQKTAYGLIDQGHGGATDLGQGSTITAKSTDNSAYGVYLGNDSGDFNMNGGAIQATSDSNTAYGIYSSGNASIDLGDNTRIKAAGTGGTGIDIGSGGSVQANQLNIAVTASGSMTTYGIELGAGASADLGSGSAIQIDGSPSYAEGIYLNGKGSSFTADGLALAMSTSNTGSSLTGRGISVYGEGASADLGSGSTITMRGFTGGGGVELTQQPTGRTPVSFKADHLTVDVTGKSMYGFKQDGGVTDLGAGSQISATGTAESIWVTGGEFKADALTVKTAQSTGISAQGGSATVKVTIGAGSVIDGRNVGASGSTNGIVAGYAGFGNATTTLDFHGTAQNRNTIYAVNGYGASAQFQGQTVNISNTDIFMSGSGSSYGLWGIGSNSLTRPGIINGENLMIDVTGSGAKGYGVVVQQGGAVNLTGNTVINTSGGTAIWNPMVTSSGNLVPGGTVTGTGKMTITGDIISSGWGNIDLRMDAGSVFTGKAYINPDPTIGSVVNLTLAPNSQWLITGSSEVSKLASQGNIVFADNDTGGVFKTLTVHDYTGGGNITFNADVSAAGHGGNQLILDGAQATPQQATLVSVNGQGYNTAQTDYSAIMLVDARNGATTQAQDFAFNPQAGNYNRDGTDTVAIGAYNYNLVRGHDPVDQNDWYISYTSTTPDPEPTPDPDPTPTPSPAPNIRPETGAYLGNQLIAQSMFNMTLHDRRSYNDTYGTDTGNETAGTDRGLWVRLNGQNTDNYSAVNGRVGFDTDSSVFEFGGDILNRKTSNGQFIMGAMGGYGHADTDASALTNGKRIHADGKVDGYFVGLYGTWYANAEARQGWYIDSWLQYAWFDNKVSGSLASDDNYNSNNWAASLETGYAWQPTAGLMVEPQAQVIFNRYDADDHRDGSGTLIRSGDSNDFTSRLGVRLSGTSRIQPYAELNWWYTNGGNSVWMNRDNIAMDNQDNVYEVRVGLQGKLSRQTHVWAEFTAQQGSHDFSSYGGTLGVNYRW